MKKEFLYMNRFRKSMRLIVALILVIAMLAGVVACDTKKGEATVYGKVEDTNYSLTYYWGPDYEDFTEEEVIRMKEAGFDTVPLYNFPGKPDQIKECLELLAKHGLNASISDSRITSQIHEGSTKAGIDAAFKEVAEDYKDYDNITEIFLFDEPNAKMFPALKLAVAAVREYFPECTSYINLLPNYAPAKFFHADTYEDYVESFAKTVNPHYICTDYYGFTKSEGRREGFAENLQILKDIGDKYGIETRLIVLLSEHGDYANITRDEAFWQAYLSLIYGTKQLSWFTYSHPVGTQEEYSNEMIDKDGKATAHYYDVQAVNNTVRVIGDALYNTSCDQVFCVGTKMFNVSAYYTYGKLGAVDKDGKDMIVGFFKDPSLIMMMSQISEKVEGADNTAYLTAASVSNFQWLNVETGCWESLESCPYVDGNTVTLGVSEAVLFRVP